jgi:hypothetical protein
MPFGERQYTVEDPEGHRWTRMGVDTKRSALNAFKPDARSEKRVRRGRSALRNASEKNPT